MPGSLKFLMNFDGMAYTNVLEEFNVCLELLSDSQKYFGFVADEFSEIEHTVKSL